MAGLWPCSPRMNQMSRAAERQKQLALARCFVASRQQPAPTQALPTHTKELKETTMGHDALKAPGMEAESPTLNIQRDQPAGQPAGQPAEKPAGPRNLPPGHPDSPGHPSKQKPQPKQ